MRRALVRPGISVMGRLAPLEDLFRPVAFAADVAAFWLALYVVTHAASSRRRATVSSAS